jgi:hypothetical protein
MSTTLNTRPYNVYRLADHDALTDNNTWYTRAAKLFITDDVEALLSDLKPALDKAGLRLRVITRDRRPVPVCRVRRRLPWVRIFRVEEDWRRYSPQEALHTLRRRHRWDKDDPDVELFWTQMATGQQVLVWDPVWGRCHQLWQTLKQCGL